MIFFNVQKVKVLWDTVSEDMNLNPDSAIHSFFMISSNLSNFWK